MLIIQKGLPQSEQQVAEYVESWKKLLGKESLDEHKVQQALFQHLYENLNILDGKAHSLIQLTGVLVTAYTVALALVFPSMLDHSKAPVAGLEAVTEQFVFTVGIAYASIAIFLCLLVIWVHWSNDGEIADSARHIKVLISVRNTRTRNFRRAWTFSGFSWVLLVGCILIRVQPYQPPLLINSFIFWTVGSGVLLHLLLIYAWDGIMLRAGLRE
jgi:hypothetical protein